MKKINFNDTNINADEILENVQELMKRQDSRVTIMDYIESCLEPRKADESGLLLEAKLKIEVEKLDKLKEEMKSLSKENEKLQEELKKKEEKIKSLEKKTQLKSKPTTTRGRRKTKKETEDVDIGDVLKEGLGE